MKPTILFYHTCYYTWLTTTTMTDFREASRERKGAGRSALNPDIWCALVTCKSAQSPKPLHFQIFKVCLDSRLSLLLPCRWTTTNKTSPTPTISSTLVAHLFHYPLLIVPAELKLISFTKIFMLTHSVHKTMLFRQLLWNKKRRRTCWWKKRACIDSSEKQYFGNRQKSFEKILFKNDKQFLRRNFLWTQFARCRLRLREIRVADLLVVRFEISLGKIVQSSTPDGIGSATAISLRSVCRCTWSTIDASSQRRRVFVEGREFSPSRGQERAEALLHYSLWLYFVMGQTRPLGLVRFLRCGHRESCPEGLARTSSLRFIAGPINAR